MGGSGNDTITTANGANTVSGGDGSDSIVTAGTTLLVGTYSGNVTVTNSATFAEMVTGSGTSAHVDQAVTVTQTAQGGAPVTRGDSHGTGLETASQVCRNLGVPPKGGQVATTLTPAANNPGAKKKQR